MPADITFNRLAPAGGALDVRSLLADAQLGSGAPDDRPYTVANFVASADGRATFHSRSGMLSDPGDRLLFHTLREHAEAVLVGPRTLANEGYGRMVPDPERRARRVAAGLEPEPLAVIITRSGDFPKDIPLCAAAEARVLVFTAADIELDLAGVAAQVEVVPVDRGALTGATALRHLRERGVRFLLCEGGPTLFGSLVHERVVDELFLTVAPKLAGGGAGPAVTGGPELPEPEALRLEWALEREGSLFLRYRLL